MGRKKKKGHEFNAGVLQGRKIPCLVLDQKWHHLFLEDKKPKQVAALEKELMGHLGRQGQLHQEQKELKKLKAKLMKNIMVNMDEIGETGQESRKLQEDRRLIGEINEKLARQEQELEELPELLRKTNEALMMETMEYCYAKMQENQTELEAAVQWITQMRIELKKKIIRKETVEYQNKEIYSYMHDIFGAHIINLFDLKYEEEQESADSEA